MLKQWRVVQVAVDYDENNTTEFEKALNDLTNQGFTIHEIFERNSKWISDGSVFTIIAVK